MEKSSRLKIDPRRRSYARLIGEISHALNTALDKENSRRGLTVSQIADLLGVNKSHISRKFAGTSNMTLETLADLAYALDRSVSISLMDRKQAPHTNHVETVTAVSSNAGGRKMASGDWITPPQTVEIQPLVKVNKLEAVE